jgi:hypothetical protein
MSNEMQTLEQAAQLLQGAPWHWSVTIEYPGFLLVAFDDGYGDRRYYAAGFANVTLTVDQQDRNGTETTLSVDTRVPTANLDGYRFAVHTAAAIDRMEHDGEPVA